MRAQLILFVRNMPALFLLVTNTLIVVHVIVPYTLEYCHPKANFKVHYFRTNL